MAKTLVTIITIIEETEKNAYAKFKLDRVWERFSNNKCITDSIHIHQNSLGQTQRLWF